MRKIQKGLAALPIAVMLVGCGGNTPAGTQESATAETESTTASAEPAAQEENTEEATRKAVSESVEAIYKEVGEVFSFEVIDDMLQDYKDHLGAIRLLDEKHTTKGWQDVYGSYCRFCQAPDKEGLYDRWSLGSLWTCHGLTGPYKLTEMSVDVVSESVASARFMLGETKTQASGEMILMMKKENGKWLIDDWIMPGYDGKPGMSVRAEMENRMKDRIQFSIRIVGQDGDKPGYEVDVIRDKKVLQTLKNDLPGIPNGWREVGNAEERDLNFIDTEMDIWVFLGRYGENGDKLYDSWIKDVDDGKYYTNTTFREIRNPQPDDVSQRIVSTYKDADGTMKTEKWRYWAKDGNYIPVEE